MKKGILIIILCFAAYPAFADDGSDSLWQQFSLDFMAVPDTPGPDEQMRYARNVAFQSAILPGLGQVRNGKIWKVPIIYAGFGGLAYYFHFNNQEFQRYSQAVRYVSGMDTTHIDPELEGRSLQFLVRARNEHQRFRDLSVLLAGSWYLLNIMDAYVDAHFRFFDVSEDLSLHINPLNFNNIAGDYSPLIGVKLKIGQ